MELSDNYLLSSVRPQFDFLLLLFTGTAISSGFDKNFRRDKLMLGK